ncbi:MAG: hypothetical protein EXR35_05965 [Limnohabitans sp.]|nr:hypothetical protein [Limnohabitans sp.]
MTQQLSTLLKAGISLLRALEMMSHNVTHPQLITALKQIQIDLLNGLSFQSALREYPHLFNDLFCEMVLSGEETGCLDVMLEKLSHYLLQSQQLKQDIKSTLSYPMTLLVVSCVVISIIV